MDKRAALKILIKHSFLLSEKIKAQLLTNLDALSDNDVQTLGTFLAEEKKVAIESADQKLEMIDELIEKYSSQK